MEELPRHISSQESERKTVVSEAMAFSVTPEEYAERRDDFPDPYEEIVAAGDIEVVCFGANHQNNPDHPQMRQIMDLMESHTPELVLVEGMRILQDQDRIEDFKSHLRTMPYENAARNGEAFVTTWCAVRNEMRVISPEPSYEHLFRELEAAGHDRRAIFLEKLLSLGVQWRTHRVEEPIDQYTEPRRSEWAKMLNLPSDESVIEQCERYARELGIPLNRSNMFEDDLVSSLQDPVPWEGKTMYATNLVAQESSNIRDRMILECVYDEMQKGTRKQMIVYGASHIHMQVSAIRKLVASVSSDSQHYKSMHV